MRPFRLAAVILWLFQPAAACAFTIVPADDGSERIFVVIEREYGDTVPLAALPAPFNDIVQQKQGPASLTFRWRYFRSDEDGQQCDPSGPCTIGDTIHSSLPPSVSLPGRWVRESSASSRSAMMSCTCHWKM